MKKSSTGGFSRSSCCMEVSAMAGVVAPVRLLGPVRAFDAGRTTRTLSSSSASFVRRTSKGSLLLFLHRTRFSSSLHSQPANWRFGQIRAASVKEVDEEEPPAQRNWKRNGNAPGSGDAQRRHFNSRNQRPASSATRRAGETERAGAGAGGRYATRSNETSTSSNASRYSQNEMGRNMQHRAPWEQGSGDRRSPPPGKRVLERSEAEEMEEVNYDDSRLSDGNYRGGGQKSAMARIVEKLRAIGNDKASSQMDFNKNRPATETSVFLPRYFERLDCSMSCVPCPYMCIASELGCVVTTEPWARM